MRGGTLAEIVEMVVVVAGPHSQTCHRQNFVVRAAKKIKAHKVRDEGGRLVEGLGKEGKRVVGVGGAQEKNGGEG